MCFYHLSDQFIILVYHNILSDQFIRPVYQISLSDQFIRPIYQASLSYQFIGPVYQTSLSDQFIRPIYKASLSGQFIRTSIFVSINFISHPVFMKTRRLYQSNDISFQLCLCIILKKGYISNHLWVHLVIK